MIDKGKIDRLIELQNEEIEIKEKISNDVYLVAKQINSNIELGSWDVDSTNVNIDWYEFWAYGGHEHTSLTFPIQCLYDEKYLKQYINELNEKQRKYEEELKNTIKSARKREYEKLKKEFENDC